METLRGHLRFGPDMRYTANGKALAKMQLYDTEDGQYATRHTIVAWEELAEVCAEKLASGGNIFVKGYWKARSWEDPGSGETKTVNEFIANGVWLIEGESYVPVGESKARVMSSVVRLNESIESMTNNILVLTKNINDVAKTKFDTYIDSGNDLNNELVVLGEISLATEWIESYCKNILTHCKILKPGEV